MDIKTKYNVGDKVYIIANFTLQYKLVKVVLPRMQINYISIKFGISNLEEPQITYQFNGISAQETEVFSDISEALAVLNAQEEL